jgi:hypothetical protein
MPDTAQADSNQTLRAQTVERDVDPLPDVEAVRLVNSVMTGLGSVRFGSGYASIEGGSASAQGVPSVTDGTLVSQFKVTPGLGVVSMAADASGIMRGIYGVFTNEKDAKGNYILREATAQESIGIQVKNKIDADGWREELMLAGKWYHAGAVFEGAIALKAVRQPLSDIANSKATCPPPAVPL